MAKIKKKTARILGFIALLIIIIVIAFNSIVANIIEHKIDAFLKNEQLKHYHIVYKRAGFNFLNRSVSLVQFEYLPDSAFLDSLDRANLNTMVPRISVGRITISGIDFRELIKNRHLIIQKITVKSSDIKMYKFNGKLSVTKKGAKQDVSIKDSVKLVGLKGLSVNNIIFKNAKFEIYNYKQKKYTLASKNITISMHGLTLDPGPYNNNYFYPVLLNATLLAKNNVLELGNKLYKIEFQQLIVDLKGQSLIFRKFHYKPLYSKKAFSSHIRFQKERFDLKAGEITFSGAEFYRFLMENEIHIKKITISDGFIDLYRDKRVPFNHNQRPLLPNETLKRLKGKLKIDTVRINNTRFDYGEMTGANRKPLSVYFTNLSGTITGISNFPYLWRRKILNMSITGKLMKKAPFHVQFLFPLAAKSDTFSFNGTVYGPVPLAIFNPAIYPAAGLQFTSGTLDKISFNGNANPSYAFGTMTMLYQNMTFQAMKKKDKNTANKFVSWGINSFVRKNNPQKGEKKEAKSVTMFFLRDIEKGLGNFFWKTLFSGMKATMIPSVNTINRKNMQSISQTGPGKPKNKSRKKE